MTTGKIGRKYFSLVIFFLRTFLFNPMNNPIFVVLAVLIVFFYIEGSLDKYHIALMLYLSIVSHCFVGNMFERSRYSEEKASSTPMTRYFQALPVSGRGVYLSYLFASAVYSIFIYVFLGFLLTKFAKLPDLKYMEFIQSVAPDGDTITTVTGIAFSRRFVPRFVSFVLEKSLLFDLVSKTGGALLLISVYFILAFVYVSVFQVFKEIDRAHRFSPSSLFHRLPLGVYLSLALIFLAEVILSQKEIGMCIRSMFQHIDIAVMLFIATILMTFASTLIMSKVILTKLKVLHP